MTSSYLHKVPQGIKIKIRLSPKAKREGIEGLYTDADSNVFLKVAVNAPPVDGKANKALVSLLAKQWGIPKTSFEIISGETDRNKTLLISGDSGTIYAQIIQEETNA